VTKRASLSGLFSIITWRYTVLYGVFFFFSTTTKPTKIKLRRVLSWRESQNDCSELLKATLESLIRKKFLSRVLFNDGLNDDDRRE